MLGREDIRPAMVACDQTSLMGVFANWMVDAVNVSFVITTEHEHAPERRQRYRATTLNVSTSRRLLSSSTGRNSPEL